MGTPDATLERLSEWRTAIARLYLTGVTTVMPIIIVAWVVSRRPVSIDGPVLYVTGAWVGFVLARVFAPPRLQAVLVVGLLFGIGVTGPSVLGLSPGPFLSGLTGAILAGTFFGRRVALGVLGAFGVVLLGYGVLASRNALPWIQTTPTDPFILANWIRLAAFTSLTTGLLIFVLTGLFERLVEAWRATAEAAERERVAAAHRREAEERAVEAQRLEAIGRLAGGVAHDFNNLLVVIMTWADLLPTARSEEEKKEGLTAIREASAQAAQLTRQLLSFARKGVTQLGPVDVEASITNTIRALRRLLPDDVQLQHAPTKVPLAWADAGQVGQVLLNLAVNARDAMPRGGTLTFRTSLAEPPGLPPEAPDPTGRYVTISVTDTGVGMDEATRARVFEPFFTTKSMGRGTGLGLATVYGIATQARGFVTVESAPGVGSTFRVAFPVAPADQPVPVVHESARPEAFVGVTHRVLLVEDDARVRSTMATALRQAGIEAVEASNAEEGLQLARRHTADLELLCTDGVMPGLPTHQLIEGFRQLYPRAPILLCSGHVEEELLVRGIAEGTVSALPKPFTAEALVTRVRELLTRRRSSDQVPRVEQPSAP
ncbi:MAG: response regulator [Myxococcaceae bacterium]|nr:response regulator [Myxococcaceae bacterium]